MTEIVPLSYKGVIASPSLCGFVDKIVVIKSDLKPSNFNFFKERGSDVKMDGATCFLEFLEIEHFGSCKKRKEAVLTAS